MLPADLAYASKACRAAPQSGLGEICFRWIGRQYKDGVTPQQLRRLAALGHLAVADRNRRGVYYRLVGAPEPNNVPASTPA